MQGGVLSGGVEVGGKEGESSRGKNAGGGELSVGGVGGEVFGRGDHFAWGSGERRNGGRGWARDMGIIVS